MLRAIIFDFDGVLVDSEPIIMKLYQEMAAKEGWNLTAEEYYRDYLALDDRAAVEHLYQSRGRALGRTRRDELIASKTRAYEAIIRNGLPPFPGAVEFVRQAASRYPLAIGSGALRTEVDHLLRKLGVRDLFAVLATADDCERSKPDPEVYLKALAALQQLPPFQSRVLLASECLAIEDAPHGIDAAQAAGMKCLALAHTRPADELRHADWVGRGFSDIDLDPIAAAFW